MSDVVALPVDRRAVVVADDDPRQRGELGEFLSRMGVSHALAADKREAVEMVRRHRPKVLLLDIRMPERDGIEAYREIVAGAGRPKVVMMSGYIERVREANALYVEPWAVIEKPIPLRTLGKFLRQVLGEPAQPMQQAHPSQA